MWRLGRLLRAVYHIYLAFWPLPQAAAWLVGRGLLLLAQEAESWAETPVLMLRALEYQPGQCGVGYG